MCNGYYNSMESEYWKTKRTGTITGSVLEKTTEQYDTVTTISSYALLS